MNKKLMLAALLAASVTAQADDWTGKDKAQHLVIGAAIGGLGTMVFQNKDVGLALGVAAGLAKEAYDSRRRTLHTVSAKDALVTSFGAYLGSRAAGWTITPRRITYRRAF